MKGDNTMAIKTKEELLESIKAKLGDDNSDEAISLIEDFSDTYNDMATRVTEAGDWKSKYEQNDAEWRQKYRDRFFHTSEEEFAMEEPKGEYGIDEEPVKKTFDDLFTTE